MAGKCRHGAPDAWPDRPVGVPDPVHRSDGVLVQPEPAQCGLGGCWVDNGTHLQQVGPNLTAPGGGVCIAQAGQVRCP